MKKKNNTGEPVTTESEILTEAENQIVKAVPEEEAGACVYCGPSGRNVVRQYTVYTGAIPESVKAFLEAYPTAKALLVPLDRFAETRKKLETKGSAEAVLYNKVKSEL